MPKIDIADPSVPDGALATRQECADFARITTTSWDRLVAMGKAPAKVTPDGVWPRWKVGHVRAWSEGRTAAGVDVTKKE